MIGHRFVGHPWNANDEHPFVVEEPSHPLTKHLDPFFRLKDEIYVSKSPFFSREKVRVLINMDLSDPVAAARPKGPSLRHDKDYTVSHIRRYGEGRVFYTSYGHNDLVYYDTRILTHYLAGLQYVTGDLDVEDEPLSLLERLKSFSGPVYVEAKMKFLNMTRSPHEEGEMLSLCKKLIQDPAATEESRHVAVGVLEFTSSPDAIALLKTALKTEALSYSAVRVLSQKLEGDEFLALCQQNWDTLPHASKINMVNTLALYGGQAVDFLKGLLNSSQTEDLQLATVRALGKCGLAAEVEFLSGLSGSPEFLEERDLAALSIAQRDPQLDDLQIYLHTFNRADKVSIQHAALRAIMESDAEKGTEVLIQSLSSDDEGLVEVAISLSSARTGESMTQALAEKVEQASPALARKIVYAIAERTDAAVLPVIVGMLGNPDTSLYALDVLGAIGTGSHVSDVLSFVQSNDQSLADAAIDALERMSGTDVDTAIISQLETASSPLKIILLKIGEARGSPPLAPVALNFYLSEDSKVSSQALKTATLCGGVSELERMCTFLLEDPENSRLRSSVAKLGSRINDVDQVADLLIRFATGALNPGQKDPFILLLGDFQSEAAAQFLSEQIKDGPDEVEVTAVKALSECATFREARVLIDVCKQADVEQSQRIAFKALARIIPEDPSIASTEKIDLLRNLLEIAKTDESRKELLEGLAKCADSGAIALAEQYLNSPNAEIVQAARKAIRVNYSLMGQVSWTFKSNVNNNPSEHQKLIDMNPATRWASNAHMSQSDVMWLMVDLGVSQPVSSIVLDATQSQGDYPRTYEIYISDKENDFGDSVATGQGAVVTEINLNAVGRYVKIVQTGKAGPFWSIHELKINGRPMSLPTGEKVSTDSYTLTASVKNEDIAKVSDGNRGTFWRTPGNQTAGQHIVIDLGQARKIGMIALDRIHARPQHPGKLNVYSTSIVGEWGEAIAEVEGAANNARTDIPLYPFGERYLKIEVDRDDNYPWEIRELELFSVDP